MGRDISFISWPVVEYETVEKIGGKWRPVAALRRGTGIVLILLGFGVCGAQLVRGESGPSTSYGAVTTRQVKVFNFQSARGEVRVTFQADAHLPGARAEVRARPSKWGYDLDARLENLPPASSFGNGYLTYVLWAITPDGRIGNIAEIKASGGKGRTDVVADFPAFGLVVTAEPYFAVPRPSNRVILESSVAQSSAGSLEATAAKYDVVDKTSSIAGAEAAGIDPGAPLALLEARNAVRIARKAGADRFASSTFSNAEQLLAKAEGLQSHHAGRKQVEDAARQAVITAEDARAIAAQRQTKGHP